MCEPDGDEIAWHTHSSGETGHLQVGGLSEHFDHLLLDYSYPDKLVAVAHFNVPEHSVEAPINDRALWMVFWHYGWGNN